MQKVALVATQAKAEPIVRQCKLYNEERNVSEEEMQKIDGCDMRKVGTLGSIEEKKTRYPRRQRVATDGQR